MPDYLLQEDGSRLTLEDGTGFLLLESLPEVIGRAIRVVWQSAGRRAKWAVSRRVKWR